MRILHLTTSFPRNPSDPAGVFILELAKHLINKKLEIDVAAPHAPYEETRETINGIVIRRLRYFLPTRLQCLCYGAGMPANLKKSHLAKIQLPFLGLVFLFHTLIHAKKYDLIHAHWNLTGLAAIIVKKFLKIPVVVNVHHGNTFSRISVLDKYIFERADCVVCNSTFTQNILLKSCTPKKCVIIPPGVDTTLFCPNGEPRKTNSLFAMGRLIEWKGFHFLFHALKDLKNEFPDIHLYLAGDGPERQTLLNLAIGLGVDSCITFLGNIPNWKTVDYFRSADVFVLPSIVDAGGNTEGLGVVLLEAMSCGTPCVASSVGGITDIVKNGYNGFLTKPGSPQDIKEKIFFLLKNKEHRQIMGRNARSFIESNYAYKQKSSDQFSIYLELSSKYVGKI